jgi:hypothetical protein
MNIYTLRDNLKQTIKGKKAYLEAFKTDDHEYKIVRDAMIEFIEVNLEELEKILTDVETYCEQAKKEAGDAWQRGYDQGYNDPDFLDEIDN